MIGQGIEQIKTKILQNSDLTEEQLNQKIQAKLDQLSGLISEEGAAHIISNELGIKLIKTEGELKVSDIGPGVRNADIVGKITRKFEVRNFVTGDRQGKVGSFMIADDTGSIRITLWNDQANKFDNYKEGDLIRIKSGMVRSNNGRPEIHLNDRSTVEINPSGVSLGEVKENTFTPATRKKLSEITENDQNVEVLGTIVQVYDIRFFEVCAECNKRAQQANGSWTCPTHGQISPDFNYVMNTFVDDGTESMRVTFWKRQIQNLLEKSDEDIQTYRTDPAAFEPFKTELLGNIVKLIGNARMNQQMNNLEFTANLVFKNPNPEEELKNAEPKSEVRAQPKPIVTESPKVEESTTSIDVHDPPPVEQKPTPEKIEFERAKLDSTAIEDDLVNIEDLDDLEELEEL